MSSRKIKKAVLALLDSQDLVTLIPVLEKYKSKELINVFFSAICRENSRVKWHAVSCMGKSVQRLAEEDHEEARIILRRLMWSLNDESGGIGWGAPEAMAEIMCCHQRLAEEYLHMLLSYMKEDGDEIWQDGNFLEHEMLQRGLLWGIARLAKVRPGLLLEKEKNMGVIMLPYLFSGDIEVQAMATLAAGRLQLVEASEQIQTLKTASAQVLIYEEGRFCTLSLGHIAGAALERIGCG